ncbi:hypothetical protein [Leucobacter sp. 7(1)]|uniref:hypothetical protein n=1 Tax=Leucobacter sp. 7(1) TaxID=1255613 RepID=UPI00111F1C02|nr:hypothetical protein [Leucobacter sp. 7(1)]
MIVMLIAGLLGMHTLSAGHSTAGTALAATEMNLHHVAGYVDADAAGDARQASPLLAPSLLAPSLLTSSPLAVNQPALGVGHEPVEHGLQALLCVLALLGSVVLILLSRWPGRMRRWAGHASARAVACVRAGLGSRPPSLIFLSISRT